MSLKSIIIFVLVTIGVLVGVTALLWNFGETTNQPMPEVKGEMRHVKGGGEGDNAVSPVLVTEFSDLQCPACAGVQEPLNELLLKYEGKVKLVFRHLPLPSIHKNAMAAAIATEAANEQGKFWELHDILFDRQTEWEKLADPQTKFAEYAEELGMDSDKFLVDLTREDLKQFVLNDNTEAIRYKIQATPTFFVDGERADFAELEAKIMNKLAE